VITELIAHIKASVSPRVEYAWTSDPVEETHDDMPVIFVAPGDYSADPSEYDNIIRQQVNDSVVCMLGCEIGQYEALRDEMRAAVLGWTHGQYDALELAAGEVLGISGSVIWIQETYSTRYLLTEG